MKNLMAISLVGFVILGACVQKASAWWFLDHKCCANICCKQYNAFSPFCCDGGAGYYPMPGYGYGGSPAYSFPGGGGNLGELPAPEMIGAPAPNSSTAPPANGRPIPNSSITVPGYNPQAFQPGVPPQPGPAWRPGMMNPAGPAGPYPGFMGYGPANGTAAPPYYPGFTGYGPANRFGR